MTRKHTEHTTLEYANALKLFNKKFTTKEISEGLNIPKGTVDGWINRGITPLRKNRIYKHLLNSRKRITKEFAYVLGAIKGDGYTVNRNHSYTISLIAKDFEFVSVFKNSIEKWSGLKCTKIKEKGNYYRVEMYSKDVYYFIVNFNLNRILNCSNKIKSAFLRGFADAEGCVGSWDVSIVNTNFELLRLCQKILRQLGIVSNFYNVRTKIDKRHKKPCYVLGIPKNGLKEFYGCVGFSIPRKNIRLYQKINGGDGQSLLQNALNGFTA